MMMAMSLMFLLVCLLNTVGLLLAKFLGKAAEIGVRQALGASRRDLFLQHLVESGCIGLAGGVLGLALAWLGFEAVIRDIQSVLSRRWPTLEVELLPVPVQGATAAPAIIQTLRAAYGVTRGTDTRQNVPLNSVNPPKLVLNMVGLPKRPEIPPKDFGQAIGLEPTLVLPFDAQLVG